MKFTKLITLLVLFLIGLQANAQNVTISPQTGSLVAALTYDGEVGFSGGWAAMWRHEQLALSLTVSDDPYLTVGGEIANPAGNLYNKNGQLVVLGGEVNDGYMVLSLPKGYRITGYTLVLQNNNVGVNFPGYGTIGRVEKSFYETNSSYDYVNYKAVAKSANNNTTMSSRSETTEYVIERTSQDEQDMSNQLYFRLRLHEHNSAYAVLTIKSFVVYFTAEGTFEAEVVPGSVGQATSCTTAPFNTSKIDIGSLKQETKDGATYFAYNYNNVQDLVAYNYLYQQDAIENGVPTDVAENKTIYPVKVDGKKLYALGNNTYYIEPPVEITTSSGNVAPIGYRVVGALFNYLWGTETTGGEKTDTYYYIKFTSGGTDYYLNTQGKFTKTKVAWELNGNYIHSGDKYLCYSTRTTWGGTIYSVSIGTSGSSNKAYVSDNKVCIGSHSTGIFSSDYFYLAGTTSASTVPRYTTSGTAAWITETDTYTVPDFKPGAYTLNVYDKTGATIQKSIKVNSAADAGGTYDMGICNNDAVKFSITGLEEGKQALVSVTLLLQALDPYIDKMDIVCHDPNDQLTLSQPFTADDFSVSGGKFVFYIPQEYQNTQLTFTFSDLYSHYGDATYYTGGNGFGRYSFVTSPYFVPINGNGNDGLYASNYNPNATYNNKVFTSTAGNIRFKFNNAEDLDNTSEEEEGYLEEYPFSVKDYLGSDDPDGGTAKGAFAEMKLTANPSLNQHSGIYYVFTADETRWNIAPSKAWQHRYYAFYRMDIELQAKTYTPDLAWEKIYDKTCYYKDDVFPSTDNGNTPAGGVNTNSMWGVKLATKDGNTIVKNGYLTYKEINDAITTAVASGDDINVPKTKSQILYVDGSDLYSMISSANVTLQTLKTGMADNALVFLPENTTSTLDNVAFKTSSGSFRAGKDIVLTDRMPFFTPYDIQVDAANKAIYTRTVTRDLYGKDLLASVILPYSLTISDGIHTNPDNTTFKLTKMASTNFSLEEQEKYNYYGQALFTNVEGDATEANKPYMVVAEDNGENSFVAAQTGAKVLATTDMKKRSIGGGEYNYLYMGEEVSGSVDTPSGNITLTAEGGYSGQIYDRAHSEAIFYFAENKFYNLYRLKSYKRYLYSYPFRGVYSFAGTIDNNVKSMNGFDITFDEGLWNTNGIVDMTSTKVPDLAVRTGKGFIQISSTKDQTVRVLSLNGTTFNKVTMNAGDSKTISLPAGVYVVNNVKITVK